MDIMDAFKWEENYSVGNETIDQHHKKLITLFNNLAKAIEEQHDNERFSTIKIISELNIYAIFHFKEEEKLMEESSYPDLEKHKLLHTEFIETVNKFRDEYLKNDNLLNYEIFNYVSEWILKHILEEDSKYKDYI